VCNYCTQRAIPRGSKAVIFATTRGPSPVRTDVRKYPLVNSLSLSHISVSPVRHVRINRCPRVRQLNLPHNRNITPAPLFISETS
jgi:hypothetical protein